MFSLSLETEIADDSAPAEIWNQHRDAINSEFMGKVVRFAQWPKASVLKNIKIIRWSLYRWKSYTARFFNDTKWQSSGDFCGLACIYIICDTKVWVWSESIRSAKSYQTLKFLPLICVEHKRWWVLKNRIWQLESSLLVCDTYSSGKFNTTVLHF